MLTKDRLLILVGNPHIPNENLNFESDRKCIFHSVICEIEHKIDLYRDKKNNSSLINIAIIKFL